MGIRGNLPKRVLFPAEFVQQRIIKRGADCRISRPVPDFQRTLFPAGINSREQNGKFWRLLGKTLKAYSGSSRKRIDERSVSARSCR